METMKAAMLEAAMNLLMEAARLIKSALADEEDREMVHELNNRVMGVIDMLGPAREKHVSRMIAASVLDDSQ